MEPDDVTRTEFRRFHTDELPRRLAAGNGGIAGPEVAASKPIALRLTGTDEAFTYVPTPTADGGTTISVVAGDAGAATLAELDAASFDGLVADLDSIPGLLYRDRLRTVRGAPMRLMRWEAALRAMYTGRPILDPSAPLLRPDGSVLDPTTTYSLDADPTEMAGFLHAAGYLVVRDVFDEGEVAAMLAAADRLAADARPGDGSSWWGRDAAGDEILTRVVRAGEEPALRALHADERLAALASLSEFELRPRGASGSEGVTVLWKHHGLTEGLGDLPWHRDCGMGGHATMCPLVVATVCLTDGGPEAGELRVLPGSWRGSLRFHDPAEAGAPVGVGLATRAGDVSLHYGDSMHASLAPTSAAGPHRISALVAFVQPTGHVHHDDERTYNDPLLTREDGQVPHLRRLVEQG